MADEHAPRVTIANGIRGYFAVLIVWNTECGGFWEPEQSGCGSYATAAEAIPEAEDWARNEGVIFEPPSELYQADGTLRT